MAVVHKRELRFTKSPIAKKIKAGGRIVVSEAFIKQGSTNLVPKIHVKRGDMVVLISGPKRDGKVPSGIRKRLDARNAYKGQIGKVLAVSPSTGRITIEGVNMITRATKQKGAAAGAADSGLIRREAALYASRVMLYCNACKKPTRVKHKIDENGKKGRICRHCSEAFDS
jgi:large subunit ribosomal protein L24